MGPNKQKPRTTPEISAERAARSSQSLEDYDPLSAFTKPRTEIMSAGMFESLSRYQVAHENLHRRFPRYRDAICGWWDALNPPQRRRSRRRDQLLVNCPHMPRSATDHFSASSGESVHGAGAFYPFMNVCDLSKGANVHGSLPWYMKLYSTLPWDKLEAQLMDGVRQKIISPGIRITHPHVFYSRTPVNGHYMMEITPEGLKSREFQACLADRFLVQKNEAEFTETYIASTLGCILAYFDEYVTEVMGSSTQLKAIFGCKVCKQPTRSDGKGLLRCSRCKSTHYCCSQHQSDDWPSHKKTCKKLSSGS